VWLTTLHFRWQEIRTLFQFQHSKECLHFDPRSHVNDTWHVTTGVTTGRHTVHTTHLRDRNAFQRGQVTAVIRRERMVVWDSNLTVLHLTAQGQKLKGQPRSRSRNALEEKRHDAVTDSHINLKLGGNIYRVWCDIQLIRLGPM